MIAVDVMGGDYAPQAVLAGALAAAKKEIPVALYGPEALVSQWLNEHEASWERYPIKIFDAQDVIAMDDEPVFAVRKKQASSLVKAVQSVANGTCYAVLSAGNSGALMAAAALFIGRQEGVERPAIAGFLPTTKGNVLALDLGANTECRPEHLLQFAHMGSQYAQHAQQIERPRVALLSNGHEEGKGSQLVKEAYKLLKESNLNFVGNIEPHGIFSHEVDVVVCDGFSGNVLLKTIESAAEVIMSMIDSTNVQKIHERLAHKSMGGALLLGVKGSVIVCHGNSDAQTIEHAISFAYNISDRK